MLTFEAFLAEYRQTMLGTYFVAQACGQYPQIPLPWPNSESDDDAVLDLVSKMQDLMPSDTLIADLPDWGIHLYDLMEANWFFGAAFGPESDVEDFADQLAAVFMEQVEKLDLDYDQFSDPEGFRDLVDEHALQFVRDWRERLFAAGSGQLTKRSVSGG